MGMQGGARIATTALRLWAVASRFLLVFFLARFLTPSDVGLYGLIVATASYALYVLGLDLYTYTTRDIISSSKIEWRSKLFTHSMILAAVGVVVAPLLLCLFVFGLLPWQVLGLFYAVAYSEHLSLEIDRALVAMSDQRSASIVVGIRQGLMPTLVVPLMGLVPATRNVETVLIAWALFNLVAVTFGLMKIVRGSTSSPIGFIGLPWVRRALLTALPFLLGTLSIRLLFTVDRQLVAVLENLEVLGAYTLAMTIAGGVTTVLAVGVHQFVYPSLVSSVSRNDLTEFRLGLRSLWLQTMVVVVVAMISVLLAYQWVVTWFDQPIYVEYAWLIPSAVAVISIYNASLVPHYALYALKADRMILMASLLALVAFAGVCVLLVCFTEDAVVSVLWSLLGASVTLFLVKWLAARKVSRRHMGRNGL